MGQVQGGRNFCCEGRETDGKGLDGTEFTLYTKKKGPGAFRETDSVVAVKNASAIEGELEEQSLGDSAFQRSFKSRK